MDERISLNDILNGLAAQLDGHVRIPGTPGFATELEILTHAVVLKGKGQIYWPACEPVGGDSTPAMSPSGPRAAKRNLLP